MNEHTDYIREKMKAIAKTSLAEKYLKIDAIQLTDTENLLLALTLELNNKLLPPTDYELEQLYKLVLNNSSISETVKDYILTVIQYINDDLI